MAHKQQPHIENNDTLGVQNALSTDDIMATLQKNNENLIAITTDFKVVSKRLADGRRNAWRADDRQDSV